MANIERIVVVAPNWLGDAVMALPALADLRRHFAGARLAVAARASVAPLFALVDGVDEVVVLPGRGGLGAMAAWKSDAAALAQGRFDTAVLLPNSLASAVTSARAGIAARWGFGTDWRGRFLTRAVPKARGPMHQAAYYQALVAGLGIATGPLFARVSVGGAGGDVQPDAPARTPVSRARQLLVEAGLEAGAPFVVFAPGAAYGRAKQWLPERFAELAGLVLHEREWSVVLVGTRSDGEVCREIRALCQVPGSVLPATNSSPAIGGSSDAIADSRPPAATARHPALVDLCGRTDLATLAGVLSLARAVVANDSGAMHLAGAVGARIVAVFGATDEHRTSPLVSSATSPAPTIVTHPVFCRRCMLRECPIDHRCMRGVTARRVLDAVGG